MDAAFLPPARWCGSRPGGQADKATAAAGGTHRLCQAKMRCPAAFLRGRARHRSPNSINSVTSMGAGPSKHAPMNCGSRARAVPSQGWHTGGQGKPRQRGRGRPGTGRERMSGIPANLRCAAAVASPVTRSTLSQLPARGSPLPRGPHLHNVAVPQVLEQRHLPLKLLAPPPLLHPVQHLPGQQQGVGPPCQQRRQGRRGQADGSAICQAGSVSRGAGAEQGKGRSAAHLHRHKLLPVVQALVAGAKGAGAQLPVGAVWALADLNLLRLQTRGRGRGQGLSWFENCAGAGVSHATGTHAAGLVCTISCPPAPCRCRRRPTCNAQAAGGSRLLPPPGLAMPGSRLCS